MDEALDPFGGLDSFQAKAVLYSARQSESAPALGMAPQTTGPSLIEEY